MNQDKLLDLSIKEVENGFILIDNNELLTIYFPDFQRLMFRLEDYGLQEGRMPPINDKTIPLPTKYPDSNPNDNPRDWW